MILLSANIKSILIYIGVSYIFRAYPLINKSCYAKSNTPVSVCDTKLVRSVLYRR